LERANDKIAGPPLRRRPANLGGETWNESVHSIGLDGPKSSKI